MAQIQLEIEEYEKFKKENADLKAKLVEVGINTKGVIEAKAKEMAQKQQAGWHTAWFVVTNLIVAGLAFGLGYVLKSIWGLG